MTTSKYFDNLLNKQILFSVNNFNYRDQIQRKIINNKKCFDGLKLFTENKICIQNVTQTSSTNTEKNNTFTVQIVDQVMDSYNTLWITRAFNTGKINIKFTDFLENFNINKLFEQIELFIGDKLLNTIDGTQIKTLLELFNHTYIYNNDSINNELIIPLCFDLFSQNNCIYLSHINPVNSIKVVFTCSNDYLNLIESLDLKIDYLFDTHSNDLINVKPELKSKLESELKSELKTNLFETNYKYFQFQSFYHNNTKFLNYQLNFNGFVSGMYIILSNENKTNLITTHGDITIGINGYDIINTSFLDLKLTTTEYYMSLGYYYMDFKNLINFNNIDNVSLKIRNTLCSFDIKLCALSYDSLCYDTNNTVSSVYSLI